MTIKNIKNDILELRGSEVSIFGQKTLLSETVDEATIDIIDVLEKLEQYEADTTIVHYDSETEEETEQEGTIAEYLEHMEELGYLEEGKSDNSYNWLCPISNHFNFELYTDSMNGDTLVYFKVHRFGDVRGNYTDGALLRFQHEEEFHEALLECNKTIEKDGHYIEVNIFTDYMTVHTLDWDIVGTIHELDELEDLLKKDSE